ncbi:MAG: D-aminoacyl-tRNA deacylase [Pseudomonadota bacterium]
MRALLQRVSAASVRVGGDVIGETGEGLLILVCAMAGDTEAEAEQLAAKAAKLRIFRDDTGRMNRSVRDIGGGALVVSQFTLAADTSRGNRPGFSSAATPTDGERLYLHFAEALSKDLAHVATGKFGADMEVSLVNDGPVTIWLESGTGAGCCARISA